MNVIYYPKSKIIIKMKVQDNSEWIQEPIYTVSCQRMLKRYRKIKLVGQGSYSKCWLVRTQNSNSTYVAKVIPKKKLQLLVKQKLVYQIKIHQQLSHPNVVHLDHWFQDQYYQYIFMEYCSQGNLENQMTKYKSMPQKDIRRYTRQVIEAIKYIHSKNILHRDLKLCNFYLDDDKNVKLGDFGFACQLSHQGELKRQTCGTPNYIAPESVSGFGYSFSSDVWAVGVILYRLKYKICPFEAKTVRQTLQKVKTCQYQFPKGQKISSQLKDLIQKIFEINYDDRLTLEQILCHPFFEKDSPRVQRAKSQAKGSFSILRNIFSRQKDAKEKSPPSRQSRLKGKQHQRKELVATKRSNSCQTFKQIKQIFKNKSKPTLITNQNTQQRTQQNSTMMYTQGNVTTNRSSFMGGSTLRSIADTSFGMSVINKRLQGSARMNHFIGNVKEQLKIQSKMTSKTGGNPSSTTGSQQLAIVGKKFYLPAEVQVQKDVVIINYKSSIKHIIFKGVGFILHRSKAGLFDMKGQIYNNPPKVLKYIVDNRIQITQGEPDEQQFGENTLQKIILFSANKWLVVKDGAILFFGTSGLFVAKMNNQQLFYIGSTIKEGDHLKQDGKVSLMYAKESQGYKCAQGVVLSRIYQGWIAAVLKQQQPQKRQ